MVAEGLCFVCKKPGHISCNCPEWTTVQSSGSRSWGLPGSQSMSMTVELTMEMVDLVEETDHIREPVDDPNDALRLGAIWLEDLDSESARQPKPEMGTYFED
ncbi:hypothetical protein BDN67DRAFT_984660 [Paxillus ammoniavirescens]|nr:hypothetical protein BDN67DRAFT_984660 [Paxillus ammoniavirescens]